MESPRRRARASGQGLEPQGRACPVARHRVALEVGRSSAPAAAKAGARGQAPEASAAAAIRQEARRERRRAIPAAAYRAAAVRRRDRAAALRGRAREAREAGRLTRRSSAHPVRIRRRCSGLDRTSARDSRSSTTGTRAPFGLRARPRSFFRTSSSTRPPTTTAISSNTRPPRDNAKCGSPTPARTAWASRPTAISWPP